MTHGKKHCCENTTLERKEEPKIRCVCCDKNLNDYESTRKHAFTGEYLDTCNACLSEINQTVVIPTITREDLANCSDIVDNPESEDYNSLYSEDINE